jgi:hypothetical protein
MMRQSIGRHVLLVELEFDGELVPKQLAHPVVLRYGEQALIQLIIQAKVVRPDDELLWSEV